MQLRTSHPAEDAQLSDPPVPGRVIVTPKAISDVVRSATLGSYGVTGLRARGPLGGRLRWLGGRPAIVVEVTSDSLRIDIRVSVAYGAPVAEVARQVDSAVRFAVRRALDRGVDHLVIHVGELRVEPAATPPPPPAERPSESVGADDAA